MKWYEETEGQTSSMRIMCMLAFWYALILSGTSAFQTIFYNTPAIGETWESVLTFLGFAGGFKLGQKFAEK